MSTQVEQPVAAAKKRKRGRETAADMVRSLGLVILVIVPLWFLAQPPKGDVKKIREVDPTSAVQAFAADVPAAPVPRALPPRWRATSAQYDGAAATVRVGWVTPAEEYAEYAASNGPRQGFLDTVVGTGVQRLDPVTVDGLVWEQYRDEDGSLSLTRSYGTATVVVGSRRATAGLEELEVLLRSLTSR